MLHIYEVKGRIGLVADELEFLPLTSKLLGSGDEISELVKLPPRGWYSDVHEGSCRAIIEEFQDLDWHHTTRYEVRGDGKEELLDFLSAYHKR